jgi:predicted nucleic acid-binding protein
MPERLLLDTDIVIHLLKKQPQIVSRFIGLLESGTVFLLSPIVVAEVYAGAFEREYPEIEKLFGFCQRIAILFDNRSDKPPESSVINGLKFSKITLEIQSKKSLILRT